MRDLVDMMNQGLRRPVDAEMRGYLLQNHPVHDLGDVQNALDRRQDFILSREGLDQEFEVNMGREEAIELLGLSRRDFEFYVQLDSIRW